MYNEVEVKDVVNEFIKTNMMFTAFDVTLKLRKQSTSRIQHYEVKQEVHKLFNRGHMINYSRTLANLPNVSPQPWVYHPCSVDPSAYTGVPVSTTAPASITSLDDGVDVAADGTVIYKFDSTDRLCVPNKLVRQLGLKKYDPVVVSNSNTDEIVVTAGLPAGATVLADYHVDRYDNVRIGRSVFAKVGIGAFAFQIEGNANKITIKKYA